MVGASFMCLAAAALAVAIWGWIRYKTPLNPLTNYSITQVCVFTLFSGYMAMQKNISAPYEPATIAKVNVVALLDLLAYALVFAPRWFPLVAVIGDGLRFLRLDRTAIAREFSPIVFTILLIGCLISFCILAVGGGGGLLWVTDTRVAYMYYRVGYGSFFALAQWFLLLALIYYLWGRRVRGSWECIVVGILFSCGAYFTGSKGSVLVIAIVVLMYYNFMVKPVSIRATLVVASLMIVGFIWMLLAQGFEGSVSESYGYFAAYVDTTARFLANVGDWGYQHGRVFLSDFWRYVPRTLFPGKPFEYGTVLIHQRLFPGAAAAGDTPGILMWAPIYWDFGLLGVILASVGMGILHRAVFDHFIGNRRTFVSFILMLQISPTPIFPFAPVPMVIVLCIGLSVITSIFSNQGSSIGQGLRQRGRW